MLERDLQDYLYNNPEVLFPGQVVSRKRREVHVQGRRIDLLFEVDTVRYIVELKRNTISREDIGQIFEYYGLMKHSNETANYRMILAAPSIPPYRRVALEEFGVRCVEVSHPPKSAEQKSSLISEAVAIQKKERKESAQAEIPVGVDRVTFEDLLPPTTPRSLTLSHLLLRDALPFIQRTFSQYEVGPVRMLNSNQLDVLCFPDESPANRFVRGGAWWAYSFGHSEQMPKNDTPNISVNALPWGLDLAVNAELQTSQAVMRQRIERSPKEFDSLVASHGKLHMQAWLKLEHQPRFYHWTPLSMLRPGTWNGQDLLKLHGEFERCFVGLRAQWLSWIRDERTDLTAAQFEHMKRMNQRPNLALRLVRSFSKADPVWNRAYDQQQAKFQSEYAKLKPLIDFFQ